MPFNLFDIVLLLVLAGGIVHGRKHGFSEELLRVIKWVALVFVCAGLYRPIGTTLAQTGVLDLLSCYLVAYLGIALSIFLCFSIVERRLAPRLVGSDVFGRGEYYLGMGSSVVRFACVLLVGLAVLNARKFTPAELRDLERFQEQAYGSAVFPNLHSLQVAVFDKSLTGNWIQQGLGFLLITPTQVNQTLADEDPNPARQPAQRSENRLSVAGTSNR